MKGVWDMKEILSGRICDLPTVDAGAHMLAGEKRIVFGARTFLGYSCYEMLYIKTRRYGSESIIIMGSLVCMYQWSWKFKINEEEYDLEAGTWVFVPSEASHSFWNTSETEDLVSLCTVTVEGDTDPLALTRGC